MPRQKNTLRIIGGAHRGRRLHFADVTGLRPTADRVRETLFNWLQGEIVGAKVLDLFAGSGALGLEALSRGAQQVVFIEKSKPAADQIHANLNLLSAGQQTRLYHMDALKWLQTHQNAFDIIFIDPPYAAYMTAEVMRQLEASHCLQATAWAYCEQAAADAWPTLNPSWRWHRQGQSGQAKYALLQYMGT